MKRIISSILAIITVFTLVSASFALAETVNPFTDVSEDAYYYESVIWAYANGITTGTTATKFAPSATCTRGQVVTFLWRAAGKPEPETKENKFIDVKESDYYYKPILWAVENGITNGTSEKMFSPLTTCTNAHIITFIWRALGEEGKTGEGEWYADALKWADGSGLLAGTTELDINSNDYIKGGCPRANVVTYLYRYDNTSSTVAKIYVSTNGNDKDADGSFLKPYKTIDAARLAVRKIDKTEYSGIDVIIAEGSYFLSTSINFTKEDSGTEACPVRYLGIGDVELTGATNLKAEDFAPATGSAAQWFKEDAKANIVQVDLKKFGYTAEEIQALYVNDKGTRTFSVFGDMPPVTADSEFLTLARFPNTEYATTKTGTSMDFDDSHDEYAGDPTHPIVIYFEEDYADTVRSWHDISTVYVWARLSYTWLQENTYMYSVDPEEPIMYCTFTGGHKPQEYGMPIYWYNIPEELDYPGEYYVDNDAIMYIYKPENFEDVTYALLNTGKLVDVKDVEWMTFENLIFENVSDIFFNIEANHFNLIDCIGRGSADNGGNIIGSNNVIDGNEFYSIFDAILLVDGGDEATLTPSNNIITNNYFHDWGKDNTYCSGLDASGIGDYIAHNEFSGGSHINVDIHGHNCIFEYNYMHDTMLQADDVGCFASTSGYGAYGNILRFNYFKNIGPVDKHFKIGEIKCYYPKCGIAAFYFDFMGCGQTIYGNVFDGIYGDGVMTSGHHNTVTNNLFVGCAKFAIEMNTCWYTDIVDRGTRNEKPDKFTYFEAITAAWKKTWPELAELKATRAESKTNLSDYWASPTHVTIKDNIVYIDKGNISVGMNPKMKMYDLENYLYSFSNIIELDEEVKYVNSKRGGYDINELVKQYSDVIGMTYEQFLTCGRQK